MSSDLDRSDLHGARAQRRAASHGGRRARRWRAVLLAAVGLASLGPTFGETLFFADLSAEIEGFGPAYNGRSCVHCHRDVADSGARYRGPTLVREKRGPVRPHFRFGDAREIPAGARVATRMAVALGGAGLVDSVSDEAILANADPGDADRDGISGRVGGVDGGRVLRFGRQAHVGTLREFIVLALRDEHGIEVEELAEGDAIVDALTEFVRGIEPLPPRDDLPKDQAGRGVEVFHEIGCARCHVPWLDGERLYTDLLLHDLGPALDDGISLNPACQKQRKPRDRNFHHRKRCSTREFRTPSLLGVSNRVKKALLHDGRAQDLEMALRLHGGEASDSRAAWQALSESDRRALEHFMNIL